MLTQEDPTTNPIGTLLVVDDNPANLGFLFDYLERCRFKVLVALDGEEALAQLAVAKPDLILLDVMMPGVDGFETCARLKDMARTRDIPVIFMSALSDPMHKLRGFDLGAVDYVTKPVNKQEVLARINAQISLRRLQGELAERNARLEEKSRALEERNEELDAFSHMVAHDLRNALVKVLGYSDLLLDDRSAALDEQAKSDLQHIRRAVLDMQDILESLLVLAQASREEVPLEPLDMGEIVARVQAELRDKLETYGAELLVPQRWPKVMGNRSWVERIWANYIENGLKYGGRPPRLHLGVDAPAGGTVRFWIRDNGPGVPAKAESLLFEPFTRLHQERASGHGLGLSIVSRIVKALGGQAGVRPLDGGGSEFFFTLRCA